MSFRAGATVRVVARSHEGHHRTPAYLKGQRGTILRGHGRFRDPETRAYGESGLPERELYLVRFVSPGGDHVLADIFEQWLEPAI